jgi:flagella basal body P-ring formation protein FlgA
VSEAVLALHGLLAAALVSSGVQPVEPGASPSPAVGAERLAAVARAGVSAWLSSRARRSDVDVELPDLAANAVAADAALRMRPFASGTPPASRMMTWIDVLKEGRVVSAVPVKVRVRAFEGAWVAAQDLRPGQLPREPLLVRREVDIAALRAAPWTADLAGVRMRRTVLAGHAVTAADVEPIPAVTRGARVMLRSRSGAVEVLAEAVAAQEGRLGDLVLVQVAGAGAPLRARVAGAGLVEFEP